MSGIRQTIEQKLQQRLSPQQIQGIKLLELPALQLEQRVKQEVEENPVLEEREQKQEQEEGDEQEGGGGGVSLEDYMRSEEHAASYKLRVSNTSGDDQRRQPALSQGLSLSDFLTEQLAYHNLDSRQISIAKFIIGTLDDDGYLRCDTLSIVDDMAFSQGVEVSAGEVEEVVRVVQMLDPAGIGARNLGECLVIQLRSLREQTPATGLAIRILEEHYDDFVQKHYQRLIRRLAVDESAFRAALEQIMHLNPKPTNGYTDETAEAVPNIIPDFILDYQATEGEDAGEFDLQLASRGVPELKINSRYLQMAERAMSVPEQEQSQADREALQFIRQKIESAKWFISAIKQRQQTLMKTMRAILHFQRDYFVEGDEAKLRPMILRDIADRAGFDISTISRVVNSKYIQTHFGVFQLKYFFSEGLLTESGEEVSTREIKRILSEHIGAEDKREPLTDEALMELLTTKGYKIARRTVAKYREMLGLPASRLRKEL